MLQEETADEQQRKIGSDQKEILIDNGHSKLVVKTAPLDDPAPSTETYQFTLPLSLDCVLAAMISVKALVFLQCQRVKGMRKTVYLTNMSEDMRWFAKWLEDENVTVVHGSTDDPDLEYVFDEVLAHQFSLPVEKHAAIAFSILVGSAVEMCLPSKRTIEDAFPVDDDCEEILVLSSKLYDAGAVVDLLHESTSASVGFSGVVHNWLNPATISKIRGCKTLIGERSVYTYIAAALDKRVVELYPDDVHRNWLSKWDSPNYRMVYLDNVTHVEPRVIWRVLEHNKWVSMV